MKARLRDLSDPASPLASLQRDRGRGYAYGSDRAYWVQWGGEDDTGMPTVPYTDITDWMAYFASHPPEVAVRVQVLQLECDDGSILPVSMFL